jgi:site-specific DNA-methyltransferase (adenine-specific)
LENNTYYTNDCLRIYHTDILATDCVPANSVDLVVTSPPYNVDIQYGAHDDQMSDENYCELAKKRLRHRS